MKTLRSIFYLFLVVVLFHSCAKEYSSEVMAAPSGSWQFTAEGTTYSGYMTDFHTNMGSPNQYSFSGKTRDGKQTFLLNIYSTELTTRTYLASQFEVTFNFSDQLGTSLYNANSQTGEFTVNVTAADSTHIDASFSGVASDENGNDIQITNGQLKIF